MGCILYISCKILYGQSKITSRRQPLDRGNTNIGLVVRALKENPALKLYIQDRRNPNSDRPTGDGSLKLGNSDTLQAEFGKDTIAVSEHPGQFKLTEVSIAAYREHVRQRAIIAASEPPYVSPAKPPPERERGTNNIAQTRIRLATELAKIFDIAERHTITKGVTFTLPSKIISLLINTVRSAGFRMKDSGSTLTAFGEEVAKFLYPIRNRPSCRRWFDHFCPNTILVDRYRDILTITQTLP